MCGGLATGWIPRQRLQVKLAGLVRTLFTESCLGKRDERIRCQLLPSALRSRCSALIEDRLATDGRPAMDQDLPIAFSLVLFIIFILSGIAICAVVFGLLVDQLYAAMGISARAMVGQAGEAIPFGVELAGGIFILILSIKPVAGFLRSRFSRSAAICSRTSVS